jgi:hypothetical protein
VTALTRHTFQFIGLIGGRESTLVGESRHVALDTFAVELPERRPLGLVYERVIGVRMG